MVRYMVLFNMPEDTEKFDQHYQNVHIPLIKSLPGLRRFGFSRSVEPVRGEPYYLISTLEWDDMTALKDAFTSPEGLATGKDVSNLAAQDQIRSMIFEIEEVPL